MLQAGTWDSTHHALLTGDAPDEVQTLARIAASDAIVALMVGIF